MTREEAIEIFKLLRQQDTRVDADEYEQALEMAISALEQEPCEDAVSRAYIEPIIEELENICINGDEHILNLLADIKNAPSVTQKPIECDDAISRDAVLDGLKGCICEEWIKTLFATMVKQLPSVSTTKNIVNHGTMNITL